MYTMRAAWRRLTKFAEIEPEEETSSETPEDDTNTDTAPPAEGRAYWQGVLASEGVLTGDGRLIELGALSWGKLPIPLRHVDSDNGGHDGARVSGTIEGIAVSDEGHVNAWGTFDLDGEAGREAYRQVDGKLSQGVSLDLDDMAFEIRVAKELMEPADDDEAVLETEETKVEDEDGRVTVVKISGDEEVMVITSARIRAATLVSIPAFIDAVIDVAPEGSTPESLSQWLSGNDRGPTSEDNDDDDNDDDRADTPDEEEEELATVSRFDTITAASIPTQPPFAWFGQPQLSGVTPLTVTKEGKVFGHIATWDTCHTGYVGQCLTPPRSASAYAYFMTGAVMTAEGIMQATGRITIDTDHAGAKWNASTAQRHYEMTGLVVADVAAGEDDYGIWVSGALRPGTTAEQIRQLRGAPMSGDWRTIAGNLELVAVLGVNMPGYPVPRPAGSTHDGEPYALVASGMVPPAQLTRSRMKAGPNYAGELDTLSDADLDYLRGLINRDKRDKARALAANVRESENRRIVRDYVESQKVLQRAGRK